VDRTREAVFLSYASEDSEAAQRIASALKAAGIEVWFDRTELRGGDAWDRRIREQIRDCRLFIAVISAHTEALSSIVRRASEPPISVRTQPGAIRTMARRSVPCLAAKLRMNVLRAALLPR
jgi:hypothetical protein